jgi:hypothetical protein
MSKTLQSPPFVVGEDVRVPDGRVGTVVRVRRMGRFPALYEVEFRDNPRSETYSWSQRQKSLVLVQGGDNV